MCRNTNVCHRLGGGGVVVKGELQEESCCERLYFTTDYKVSYCQKGTQGLIFLMANTLQVARDCCVFMVVYRKPLIT